MSPTMHSASVRNGLRTIVLMMFMIAASTVLIGTCSDGSDAATTYTSEVTIPLDGWCEIDLSDHMGGDTYNHTNYDRYTSDDSLPKGMSRDGRIISGTPTEIGTYELGFRFHDSMVALSYDAFLNLTIYVIDSPETFRVTYNAGVGTVDGLVVWSEDIVEGTYATLPDAVHSTGAYSFLGWSLSKTSSDILSTYRVTSDVTLYAVWERNTVSVDDITATISRDQTSRVSVSTDPTDAKVSVSTYGGLQTYNLWIDDGELVMDMTGVTPGRYIATLQASYTGFLTGTSKVTIDVPIAIIEPVEYTLSKGDVFVHTPVTDPSNASIELRNVSIDGTPVDDMGGLTVEGRTITGTLSETGTYEVVYRASMPGYVDVTNTVLVMVMDPSGSDDPVSLASVSASKRVGEVGVYDFAAIGGSNVSNYVWSVDGEVFASSSPTALYSFPSSGVYTVTCTAYGHDGGSVHIDITVVVDGNRHRGAAWSGVEYGHVIEGEADVTISDGSPFKVSERDIDGRTYTIISGTPTDAMVGSVFDISVDDDGWNVTVYGSEDTAPVADFITEVGGYSVTVIFTGSHASFHGFDFDGDGTIDEGDSFTYDGPGRYSISCTAVNNVSEVTCKRMVEVGLDNGGSIEVSVLDDLTDFSMVVGDRLYIGIPSEGHPDISIGGSAADFTTLVDGSILVEPETTGVYDLTITVTGHDSSVQSKTVEVTVRERPTVPVTDSDNGDSYMGIMVVLFIIGVGGVGAFLFLDSSDNGGDGRGRGPGAGASGKNHLYSPTSRKGESTDRRPVNDHPDYGGYGDRRYR